MEIFSQESSLIHNFVYTGLWYFHNTDHPELEIKSNRKIRVYQACHDTKTKLNKKL